MIQIPNTAAVEVVALPGRKFLYFRWKEIGRRGWRYQSAGTHDWTQAKQLATTLERERSVLDLQEFERRFASSYSVDARPSTNGQYLATIRSLREYAGNVLLAQLTPALFAGYAVWLKGAGKSTATQACRLSKWRTLLKWAHTMEWIAAVPHVRLPRQARAHEGKGRAITADEFQRMLAAVPTVVGDAYAERWQQFLRGLWWSGLRLTEAMQLSWDPGAAFALDLEGRKFPALRYSSRQKSGRNEILPLLPEYAAILRAVPPEQRQGKVYPLDLATRNVPPVIASLTISEIGRVAEVFVNDKGKPASAHDFRRSFCTRLAQAGTKPAVLQKLSRHSSINVTLRYYVDLACDDLAAELYGSSK